MTMENFSILIMAGAVGVIFALLCAWLRVIDRIALWVIRMTSKNIPNWFKGLF